MLEHAYVTVRIQSLPRLQINIFTKIGGDAILVSLSYYSSSWVFQMIIVRSSLTEIRKPV